jgi:hypothetical protein
VLSPVVVGDLDFVCVALAEFKADAPSLIDGHRPLVPALTLELVEPDAFERAEIAQRFGNVQRQQQVHCRAEVQPAKLVRPFAFPDLAGHGIPPRPDHGINVLRHTVKRNPLSMWHFH